MDNSNREKARLLLFALGVLSFWASAVAQEKGSDRRKRHVKVGCCGACNANVGPNARVYSAADFKTAVKTG